MVVVKRNILIAATIAVSSLIAFDATAELYKYRTSNGELIITSEKRSDLELVEVVSGGPRLERSTTKKPAKRSVTGKSAARHTPNAKNDVPRHARESAFDDIIAEAAEAYDVPFGFVKAVIRVESNFQPNAVSKAGAMGLMQLMPRTAASLNVTDAFDPRQNIFGGTKFLRILTDRYDGDINLILAAYNAGDAAVARYDGIPYPKTRGYVSSVYRWYQIYSAARDEE